MNQFLDTQDGMGMLKDYYAEGDQPPDQSTLAEVLKQRRQKLMETKLGTQMNDETSPLEQEMMARGGLKVR